METEPPLSIVHVPHKDETSSSSTLAIEDGAPQPQDDNGIELVPFTKDHGFACAMLTLREFPFPENVGAAASWLDWTNLYGVVAMETKGNRELVGYFLGKHMWPVGLRRKKVANLFIVGVSSQHQNKGIAKRLGEYMMQGHHPTFRPSDYDEILVEDTDTWNSPSWLFSDRAGFRYFPTHDIVRRLGLVGYLQLLLFQHHAMPCQFLKRRVKNEQEARQADAMERQKGVFACVLSGLLPATFWILHWLSRCGTGNLNVVFVAYAFGAVYGMLLLRFLLAHAFSPIRPVFREYDFWWSPIQGALGWALTIFGGVPLLGWTGGFYLGVPGINYLQAENRRGLGLMYLPINLLSFLLFSFHALLRVVSHSALLKGSFLDVLGTAAFFFSMTDLAMPITAVPSGAMAIRRWNFAAFVLLWLAWMAVLLVSILIPDDSVPSLLDLTDGACKNGKL